jgi:transposase
MVQAYSPDLRSRVIKATAGGMSARQAAERFGVGISTAIVWVRRYRQNGEAVARRQGKPRGSRLDSHEGFILDLVETGSKDISLAEIAERLSTERGLRVGITSIWTFLDRHGLTFKKRPPTRRSSSARMCLKPGKLGSMTNSISTPRS